MSFDKDKANWELAALCGIRKGEPCLDGTPAEYWVHDDGHAIPLPDFFAGLRADGTCDEAAVDGDLLWKVMMALSCYVDQFWPASPGGVWRVRVVGGGIMKHAHPIAALYLCARAAGILKGGSRCRLNPLIVQ